MLWKRKRRRRKKRFTFQLAYNEQLNYIVYSNENDKESYKK